MDDQGRLTSEQALELGTIGGTLTLRIAEEARDFCNRHGVDKNDERHFNAAVMTILETMIFLSVTGAYGTQPQAVQLRMINDMHDGARGTIRKWNAHKRRTQQ